MSVISYQQATRRYPGNPVAALDALDLEVADGEFMVLVGPSGSGKSTALRMLAGLEPLDDGAILIDGHNVSKLAAKDRDLAMVFQNYALYPHMSVRENMAFSLRMARIKRPERRQRVEHAAKLLGLEPYLDRKPAALSGGQRQRVAMGRAIVREPKAFLMDEPLSNLDAKLRVETRANLAALQARLGTTTVYVTHDQVEAMTMGHRVALLKDGVLQQVDTPAEIYARPANAFVASFIGSPPMNLRVARIEENGIRLGTCSLALSRESKTRLPAADTHVTVGLRPEELDAADPSMPGAIELQISLVEVLGADVYVYGTLAGDDPVTTKPFAVRLSGPAPRQGAKITIAPRPQASIHVFDESSGVRLG
jgi:multiple sugar transport system ATP-binding protein